jgi:hypothetical protein
MKLRILFLALIALLLLSACSAGSAGAAPAEKKLAPLHEMPDEVQRASVSVQQAYQYAVANPDVTQAIPCYCGCGAMGHTSNYSCYVQSEKEGRPVFDPHALGCSICVDITVDAMRMQAEGKSLPEIRASIDQTYSQYGPTNMGE